MEQPSATRAAGYLGGSVLNVEEADGSCDVGPAEDRALVGPVC